LNKRDFFHDVISFAIRVLFAYLAFLRDDITGENSKAME